MSTTTTQYKFIKPELTDAADITATNQNWDIIDAELKKKYDINNKPTASEIGAVSSNDCQYKFYDNLADIGITAGNETVLDIFNAMPIFSVLRYVGTSAHNPEIYPNKNAYGQIEFVKLNDTYCHATFFADTNNTYRGTYELYVNRTNVYGWFKIYTEENKPTASDVGALALTGGELTGTLKMPEGSTIGGYTPIHTGNKEQIFTYGTTDLTAGTSTLETGKLHFVYE